MPCIAQDGLGHCWRRCVGAESGVASEMADTSDEWRRMCKRFISWKASLPKATLCLECRHRERIAAQLISLVTSGNMFTSRNLASLAVYMHRVPTCVVNNEGHALRGPGSKTSVLFWICEKAGLLCCACKFSVSKHPRGQEAVEETARGAGREVWGERKTEQHCSDMMVYGGKGEANGQGGKAHG